MIKVVAFVLVLFIVAKSCLAVANGVPSIVPGCAAAEAHVRFH